MHILTCYRLCELQLTVIAPDCTKFLTESVKTSLQVRCSKTCMEDSGWESKRELDEKVTCLSGEMRKNKWGDIPRSAMASAHSTVKRPQDTYQRMKLTATRRVKLVAIYTSILVGNWLVLLYLERKHFSNILIPEENMKTNTQRGRPHMWIALLADGRPRITGLATVKQLITKSRLYTLQTQT